MVHALLHIGHFEAHGQFRPQRENSNRETFWVRFGVYFLSVRSVPPFFLRPAPPTRISVEKFRIFFEIRGIGNAASNLLDVYFWN